MRASIDAVRREVHAGGRRFGFRLDLRDDAARVAVGEREYRVRPLRWREKITLARYAGLPAEELEEQFVRLSAECDGELGEIDRAVLAALARWVNEPADGVGVPLDARSLAAVTVQLCRSTHLKPADFEAMPAVDVEAMWLALGEGGVEGGVGSRVGGGELRDNMDAHTTRIQIVPDPAADERVVASERAVAHESATSVNDGRVVNDRGATANESVVAPDAVRVTDRITHERAATSRRTLANRRVPVADERAAASTPAATANESTAATLDLTAITSRPTIASEAIAARKRAAAETAHPSEPARNDDAPEPRTDRSAAFPALPLRFRVSYPRSSPDPSNPIDGTTALAPQLAAEPERSAELQPSPEPELDADALFEELADRLAQAAADMGVVES